MKLRIDTESKTITIEESVNIDDFFKMVERLLPNDLWKDFKLETNVINNWTAPIIIKEYPIYPVNPYPLNPYPPTWPWITYGTGDFQGGATSDTKTTYCLNSGVFNIDCVVK